LIGGGDINKLINIADFSRKRRGTMAEESIITVTDLRKHYGDIKGSPARYYLLLPGTEWGG
jgi:hypothetical protein